MNASSNPNPESVSVQAGVLGENELRVKVAKLCGWQRQERNGVIFWRLSELYDWASEYESYSPLPDYPNDLNAMHEVLNDHLLSNGSWSRYRTALETVCNTRCQPSTTAWIIEHNATARQRAEAFVKTMEGKSHGN